MQALSTIFEHVLKSILLHVHPLSSSAVATDYQCGTYVSCLYVIGQYVNYLELVAAVLLHATYCDIHLPNILYIKTYNGSRL